MPFQGFWSSQSSSTSAKPPDDTKPPDSTTTIADKLMHTIESLQSKLGDIEQRELLLQKEQEVRDHEQQQINLLQTTIQEKEKEIQLQQSQIKDLETAMLEQRQQIDIQKTHILSIENNAQLYYDSQQYTPPFNDSQQPQQYARPIQPRPPPLSEWSPEDIQRHQQQYAALQQQQLQQMDVEKKYGVIVRPRNQNNYVIPLTRPLLLNIIKERFLETMISTLTPTEITNKRNTEKLYPFSYTGDLANFLDDDDNIRSLLVYDLLMDLTGTVCPPNDNNIQFSQIPKHVVTGYEKQIIHLASTKHGIYLDRAENNWLTWYLIKKHFRPKGDKSTMRTNDDDNQNRNPTNSLGKRPMEENTTHNKRRQ